MAISSLGTGRNGREEDGFDGARGTGGGQDRLRGFSVWGTGSDTGGQCHVQRSEQAGVK
jgi:hypothetical protein